MKKFKMKLNGYTIREFDYNGQIWLTNGHIMVDSRFVSLWRKKSDSIPCEKNEGSNVDMIMRNYQNVLNFGSPLYYLSQEEVNQVFQDTEFKRLKICFTNKGENGENSNPLFIDGNFYSWFYEMSQEKDFGLYSSGDCYNPIFLVNHKEKQVIGCLMPLRY